jgi:hypothetical protein
LGHSIKNSTSGRSGYGLGPIGHFRKRSGSCITDRVHGTEDDEANLSREGRASLRHPEVKEAICSLTEFQEWMHQLPEVVVDEVKYYVRGGDMLKDSDEVLWEWARKHRPDLIPPGEE